MLVAVDVAARARRATAVGGMVRRDAGRGCGVWCEKRPAGWTGRPATLDPPGPATPRQQHLAHLGETTGYLRMEL
jgi:hypothetical protein